MMNNLKEKSLIILRGAPGSGKDTFIDANKLNCYTVSTDKIRKMYRNPIVRDVKENDPENIILYTLDQDVNSLVFETFYKVIEYRLKHGDFTILNDIFSTKEEIEKVKEIADKYEYKIVVINFDLDKSILKARNELRYFGTDKDLYYIKFPGICYIPNTILDMFFERFSLPLEEVIPESVEVVEYNLDNNDKIMNMISDFIDDEKIRKVAEFLDNNDKIMNIIGDFIDNDKSDLDKDKKEEEENV